MKAAVLAVSLLSVLALAACGGSGGSSIDAGRKTFVSEGCGSGHTVAEAATDGTLGPNLGEALAADAEVAGRPLDEFVRTSIVAPDAFVMPRYLAGTMPPNYGDLLSEEQIDDLVAFLVDAAT